MDLDFSLNGRTALVTGGASGIGWAIAQTFSAKGAQVAIADLNSTGAAERAAALPGPAQGYALDVTAPESVTQTVDRVIADHGRIDVLVNSAGIGPLAPAEDLGLDVWDPTIAVNLRGTFLVAQAVGRQMLEQGAGSIINLASQAASAALDQHAAYCASKAGVLGLTRVLALEWGGRGVRCNAISPTVVMTELGRYGWAGAKGDAFKQLIPTGRFAEPDEIAAAALFLASDNSLMINGVDLPVDGGFLAR
ncbi:GolD/DthD family dehydrogenase [Microlunatus soli]|uniref:NAD(P)-dependent dehydrogenase, short-chain alcohol dehydrogenase family n=1 Tax=Microlunatus soli TaxID=630515 RepID=A0A1H2A749_9ACTN|nr:D-threitol dehydrogenase [Microlunatus soli]SDT41697.1 NAD(P)-dependent dehydrogenase, short-chain alcohol dehydrogenase family [Microlunatus soli]